MRTSIGLGNKVRRGNFIKKRAAYEVKDGNELNSSEKIGRIWGMACVLPNS